MKRTDLNVIEHFQYDKAGKDCEALLPYWKKVKAVEGGIETVKAMATDFLPKFPEESTSDYDFRISLLKLTDIYGEAVQGIASKPFQEDVTIEEINGIDLLPITENIDGMNNNLTRFAFGCFNRALQDAMAWIFVDYPNTAPIAQQVMSVAQVKALNLRPYWSRIDAENVLEATSEFIASKEVLTYIRIKEHGEPLQVREFLRLDGGQVIWSVKQKNAQDEWFETEGGQLSISQIPLVPIFFGDRAGRSFQANPPLRKCFELQQTLIRQETALEFTKTMAAFPMLCGNGVRPPVGSDGKTPVKLKIGPNVTLYAPPNGDGHSGQWAYVEPSATSLKFQADDIKETKNDVRDLGKSPTTAQSMNVTTIGAGMLAGRSKSFSKACGVILKDALEKALVLTLEWLTFKPTENQKPVVKIFDDYDNFAEGSLEALIAARNKGDISRETFLGELKRRLILSADFDYTKEAQLILNETPSEVGEDDTDPDTLPGA